MGKETVSIAEFETLKAENLMLKMELANLKKLIFGSKTERYVSKTVDPAQATLFPQAELKKVQKVEKKPKAPKQQSSPKPKKKKKAKGFPAFMERVVEQIEVENLNKDQVKLIGEDVTELLAYKKGYFYIRKIVRPRYAKNDGSGVLQANIPDRLLPKSKLDESLVAHLIVEKACFHTPIYRFAQKMELMDCEGVSNSTLHNGFHRATEMLTPLYDLMLKELQESNYLQADESPIKVLNHQGKKKESKGYMWVYRNPNTGAVIFSYDPTRSQANPDIFLENFKGYLQTDGYSSYDKYDKRDYIILLNCMAHSRRKFVDALKYDEKRANYFLEQQQKLYALERKAKEKNLSTDEILEMRQNQALPILKTMKEWMMDQQPQVPPSSAIGKAIYYSLKRWKLLSVYTSEGYLEIDNNLIENKIRPLALGRKNYLFAHNENTAQNLAMLYSFIGTCHANDINPIKYISWILKKVVTDKITPDAVKWLPHHIDPALLDG